MHTKKLVEMRNWVVPGQQPTALYYFKLKNGQVGESESPLCLFDLLIDENYSDCDDRQTQIIMLGLFAKQVSVQMAAEGIRTIVYDGAGPFFDAAVSRHLDEIDESEELFFQNKEDPYVIDFLDEWTLISSLIRCGYLKLFEKVETFGSASQEVNCKKCFFYSEADSCNAWNASMVTGRLERTCPFWTDSLFAGSQYREVTADDLFIPNWKNNYRPISERTNEYEGFRIQR